MLGGFGHTINIKLNLFFGKMEKGGVEVNEREERK